jgi:hypothetical protein
MFRITKSAASLGVIGPASPKALTVMREFVPQINDPIVICCQLSAP